MECPTCKSSLQQLLTSTYCPTCEEAEKSKEPSEANLDEVEPKYTVTYNWSIQF